MTARPRRGPRRSPLAWLAAAALLVGARDAVAERAGRRQQRGGGGAALPVIDLPDTPAQLQLEPAWRALSPQTPTLAPELGPMRLVALLREGEGEGALALVVLRFDAPNAPAWRGATRGSYADAIEAGMSAAIARRAGGGSYQRLRRSWSELEGVPALELEFGDGAGAVRLVRLLLFRTYAIVAAIELPPSTTRARRALAQRALASFTPAPAWQR